MSPSYLVFIDADRYSRCIDVCRYLLKR